MHCFDDPSKINLQSDLFTNEGILLDIKLIRCVEEDYCKSKEEIDAKIDSLVFWHIYNTQTYNPNVYGDGTIKNESKLDFLPIRSFDP